MILTSITSSKVVFAIVIKTKIPVQISVYFIAMVALCFAAGSVRQICLGLGFAALHELGHLAALAACGARPNRLCFTAAGVRIERCPGLTLSFPQEIAVAFAGPAASLALAGLFAAIWRAGAAPEPRALLLDCCLLNLGFGLFNLLPVRQLDGGRALYYLLCRRIEEPAARRIVLAAGLVILFFAALLAGLACLRQGGVSMSLIIVVVYLAICC